MGSIKKQLDISRMELLDMGIRGNTLLHFRATAKTLSVVDERSDVIFERLVEQQQAMSFIPLPAKLLNADSELASSEPLEDQLQLLSGPERHIDCHLQTKLAASLLDKRLLKISTEANSFYQEQGVDILYLALGFLTWYEDGHPDKARQAPLILVPVKLQRGSAKERFKLHYTQADLGPNLTLAAKLKMELKIELPEFAEELTPEEYFAAVEAAVAAQPRWQVSRNHVALGLFSFGKFQMYQDLAPDSWPSYCQPDQHPVLQRLLGEGFKASDSDDLPVEPKKALDLTGLSFVKDADSSQTSAILAVRNGESLVIQGPPGTGKSQTITNIISQSIADGKSVLFVAEKMAALEVVKSRLDDCQLGEAVLELHSHKSNKKSVLSELRRTLELGVPKVEDCAADKARHRLLQHKLDRYCREVNAPILNSGMSYIDALGYDLQLSKESSGHNLPVLDFELMREWDSEDFDRACTLVRPLVSHLSEMGVPSSHPFSQSKLEDFSPAAQSQLLETLAQCDILLADSQQQSRVLAKQVGLPAPTTVNAIVGLCAAVERLLSAPRLAGLNLEAAEWRDSEEQINQLIATATEISVIKNSRSGVLIDQAWSADLLAARQAFATTGEHWWRSFSGAYRRAEACLKGLLLIDLPESSDDCLALLDDVLKVQSLNERFEGQASLGERLFGSRWRGLDSDWVELQELAEWLIVFYRQPGPDALSSGALRFLQDGDSLAKGQQQLACMVEAVTAMRDGMESLAQQLKITRLEDENVLLTEEFGVLQQRCVAWREQVDSLYQMTRYNCLARILRSKKLTAIEKLAFHWQGPPHLLLTTLKKTWYEGLLHEAYSHSVSIKHFDRLNHENIIDEFKTLDGELFLHAQEALVERLHENLPHASAAGEAGIIRHEMSKKRRHMPLRRLLKQAGRAVQQIKPVFMMSPMSVATYLEQGAIDFDLLIFDEASQIKVVDAIGPILRAKQVVVVGDTRQMPPTDFFSQSLELEDEEAERSQTADIESILNMFISKGAPETMLRWHYRSRHDSLITVSNHEFYDGKLMIFPSPGVNAQAKGLSFQHIPEAIYDRGASRTNPLEAKVVAEAVLDFAQTTPQLSLGVVAFSTAQRDCILEELEHLRRENPDCEDFFNEERLEGFFVKNLENVQGDERDTIFVSIGYGRTIDGGVSKSFGPINLDGGERRLNVLITRARLAMEVFCNFTAEQLGDVDDSPFGVRALKSFIHYAESGDLVNECEPVVQHETPFENQVTEVIQSLGYEVEAQLGTTGFSIDIAVRDPQHSDRYLLAVETDGANYGHAKNARDRDRLRQSVLEGLGWRCHRVWSTDWFRSPKRETDRLKEAIDEAVSYYHQLDDGAAERLRSAGDPNGQQARVARLLEVEGEALVPAYTLTSGDIGIARAVKIHKLHVAVINKAVQRIVEIEGPLHIKDVADRLSESAGYVRVGPRVVPHLEASLPIGHAEGLFYLENNFIYCNGDKQVAVRDRSALTSRQRKLEHIPPEELEAALLLAIEVGFSLSAKAAVTEALTLLGFQRKTEKARLVMAERLKQLLAEGRVKQEGELISCLIKERA